MNKFIFDECGNFVRMCKSCFMSVNIFSDMGLYFCIGHEILNMENFCWTCNFCHGKLFLLGMILVMGKNFCWVWEVFIGMGIFF